MGKKRVKDRITRRDFLEGSGSVASAAPAVMLLLSAASIPSNAIAQYVPDSGKPPLNGPV